MGIFGKKNKKKTETLNVASQNNNNNNNNTIVSGRNRVSQSDEMIAVKASNNKLQKAATPTKPSAAISLSKLSPANLKKSWKLKPKPPGGPSSEERPNLKQQEYPLDLEEDYPEDFTYHDIGMEDTLSNMEEMTVDPHVGFMDPEAAVASHMNQDANHNNVPKSSKGMAPPPPPAATSTAVNYQNGDKYYKNSSPSFHSSYDNQNGGTTTTSTTSHKEANSTDSNQGHIRNSIRSNIAKKLVQDNPKTHATVTDGSLPRPSSQSSHSKNQRKSKSKKGKKSKHNGSRKEKNSGSGRSHRAMDSVALHSASSTPAGAIAKSVIQMQQQEILAMQLQGASLRDLSQHTPTAESSLHSIPTIETPNTAPPSMEELNEVTRDLVKTFIGEIWNRGEIKSIAKVCSPRLRFNSHTGMEKVGHEGFSAMVKAVRTSLEDYHCEIHSMVVEGRKCFCRLKFTGKHVGELMGYPPTHKLVAWMGASEFTVCPRRNQILKVWELGDILSLEKQLRDED